MFKKTAVLMNEAGELEQAGSGADQQAANAFGNVSATPVAVYRVWDMLASRGKPREHEIIIHMYNDGREPDTMKYLLSSDGPGEQMPVDHALKFLSSSSFVVKNTLGDRIAPPASVEGGLGALNLAADQTVALYSELSKVALYKRCKLQPGGEQIHAGSAAEEMCAFLQAVEERRRNVHAEDPMSLKDVGEDIGGRASQEQLAKMFN